MTDHAARPDPDALLRRVQEAEARSKRGRLKLFFGFAPGVGKTYRMLQVARELIIEQDLDVVVGVVDDHRRRETAELVLGLELLPRREIPYRGQMLQEFDLDAALARRPALLLVDELAHTNAPGSRHPKRWQDVQELLDAGIDVFTTMNVQHLESLNDVIAQITHVQVRETVPDGVLARADAVELVDIAPEELLERLREGKVYLPEQARRAAAHFFQRGNLLALRELALRRTAERVDADVLEFREAKGISSAWPAVERVMVCVGPAPSSGRLIRAAARMAAGLRCPWVATYVEATTAPRPLLRADRDRLEAHLKLAESLGATVTRLSGPRIGPAVLDHARRHNVTRLVIGKPTHARLWDRLGGSLVDELVRGSGDIDVLVSSGDPLEAAPVVHRRAAPTFAPLAHYASAAAVVGVTLALALLVRGTLHLPDTEMLFLLAVMICAVRFGKGPSIAAAAAGVAAYNFFFVPPYFTLSAENGRYFLTFGMMFGVGYVMSELAARLKRQEHAAVSRESRTAALYELTRELSSTDEASQIGQAAARHAASTFGANVVLLGVGADGQLEKLAAAPRAARLDEKDLGVARWSHAHRDLAGRGTDTLPGAGVLCAPLLVGSSRFGVIALALRDQGALTTEQRDLLDVHCRQTAAALKRARFAEDAMRAELRAKTEALRASLLTTVSHDLRTPLASITKAATSMRDDEAMRKETRDELVATIVGEAERLEQLVANLHHVTHIESGAMVLERERIPLEELVGAALSRLADRLESREVTVSIAPGVPLVFVDPILFEQVFVNLLENAAKYTPAGSPIEIVARKVGERVEAEIRDFGDGIAKGTEERVFEKFYRGPHVGGTGAGLGLSICKGLVEAHGGTLSAARREEGGSTFRISIPSGDTPPVPSPVAEEP